MTIDLFEEPLEFPDPAAERRYQALVGLDTVKARLEKEAAILLKPELLEKWSKDHHDKKMLPAAEMLLERPPMLLFGGDVGTGKTTLAETFGDAVARRYDIPVRVYRLSLQSRGSGAVGEMSSLLSGAFAEVRKLAKSGKGAAHVLVIDEADALAQSRELDQMHHEDRAGVNALIRGLDQLSIDRLHVLVVLCTNRLESIDPGVRRRAAGEFIFLRPNEDQRLAVLRAALKNASVTEPEFEELVRLTGEADGRTYGYTYSDLVNKVIPAAVLDAFPDRPLTGDLVKSAVLSHPPTRPFLNGE
jgi:AAA+ superfamily predicted ATPase